MLQVESSYAQTAYIAKGDQKLTLFYDFKNYFFRLPFYVISAVYA